MKYNENTINRLIKTIKQYANNGNDRISLNNGLLRKLGYSIDEKEGKTSVPLCELYDQLQDIKYKIEFSRKYEKER